jgi:hypothetical protein
MGLPVSRCVSPYLVRKPCCTSFELPRKVRPVACISCCMISSGSTFRVCEVLVFLVGAQKFAVAADAVVAFVALRELAEKTERLFVARPAFDVGEVCKSPRRARFGISSAGFQLANVRQRVGAARAIEVGIGLLADAEAVDDEHYRFADAEASRVETCRRRLLPTTRIEICRSCWEVGEADFPATEIICFSTHATNLNSRLVQCKAHDDLVIIDSRCLGPVSCAGKARSRSL